jgi:hypothetical protein
MVVVSHCGSFMNGSHGLIHWDHGRGEGDREKLFSVPDGKILLIFKEFVKKHFLFFIKKAGRFREVGK